MCAYHTAAYPVQHQGIISAFARCNWCVPIVLLSIRYNVCACRSPIYCCLQVSGISSPKKKTEIIDYIAANKFTNQDAVAFVGGNFERRLKSDRSCCIRVFLIRVAFYILVVAFLLFERSEFLIATCKKKNMSVCVDVRLILVLVLGRQTVYGQKTVYLCLPTYT